MAKVLEFPYARVRLETQSCQAVILRMPERKECPIAMLPALMAMEWLKLWMDY
jgi:hypothetical protein